MTVQTPKARPGKRSRLLGPDRKPYLSHTPGRYGGYRPLRGVPARPARGMEGSGQARMSITRRSPSAPPGTPINGQEGSGNDNIEPAL